MIRLREFQQFTKQVQAEIQSFAFARQGHLITLRTRFAPRVRNDNEPFLPLSLETF